MVYSIAKYKLAVDGECAGGEKTNQGSGRSAILAALIAQGGVLGTGLDIAGMKSGPRSGVSPF